MTRQSFTRNKFIYQSLFHPCLCHFHFLFSPFFAHLLSTDSLSVPLCFSRTFSFHLLSVFFFLFLISPLFYIKHSLSSISLALNLFFLTWNFLFFHTPTFPFFSIHSLPFFLSFSNHSLPFSLSLPPPFISSTTLINFICYHLSLFLLLYHFLSFFISHSHTCFLYLIITFFP